MSKASRLACWLLLCTALGGSSTLRAGATPRAGQDPIPPVEPDDADRDARRPTVGDLDGSFVMTETQFNVWAFGTTANLATVRARYEGRVARQLEELERTFPLDDAQRDRLRLAAAGDVKMLFDGVDARLRRYADRRFDGPAMDAIQAELKAVHDDFDAGLMSPASLSQKTLRTMLGRSQAPGYEPVQRQRQMQRFRERLDQFTAHMLANLKLSDDQTRRLARLVKERIPPARQADLCDSATHFGIAVYDELARVPEPELRAILDEPQFERLQEILKDERKPEAPARRAPEPGSKGSGS